MGFVPPMLPFEKRNHDIYDRIEPYAIAVLFVLSIAIACVWGYLLVRLKFG